MAQLSGQRLSPAVSQFYKLALYHFYFSPAHHSLQSWE
jgi:hypothetical protein